jgi:P-type Cu2+ transporter
VLAEGEADFYMLDAGWISCPGAGSGRAFGFAMMYHVATVAFEMAGRNNPLLAAVLMPLSSIVLIVMVAGLCRGKITDQ